MPDMMDRTRAAVGFCNSRNSDTEANKMAAFLGIFHPEVKGLKHVKLMQDARQRDRRR